MSLRNPLRHPDTTSREVMTRRAWWLVVLNILFPGSVQLIVGNRVLGRVGAVATLALWAALVGGLILRSANPGLIFSLVTNPIALAAVQGLLVGYVVLWVALTFDTLRLVRLVRVAPGARAFVAGIAVLVLVGLTATAGYGAHLAQVARGTIGDVFVSNAPPDPPVDGRYNIMLLGGDAGAGREGMRPDSMSVVSVDAETGEAVLIGLPRDLRRMPFPDSSPLKERYPNGYGVEGSPRCDVDVCQLNSVFSEVDVYKQDLYPDARARGSQPGVEGMRDAIEGATGLTIQYYVLIEMQSFTQLVDALGGVDIDVAKRLPIGGDENHQGVSGWIEPGKQHMDGFTAQWYARSRYGTSDYDRMERQKQIMEAILSQVSPVKVVSSFEPLAKAGGEMVSTDIPADMLGFFIDLAMKTREHPLTRLELVPPLVDPAHADYEQIHKLVQDAIAGPSKEPVS